MDVKQEVKRQAEHVTRGAVDVVPRAEFEAKLARSIQSGKPLRVKFGIDPTHTHVHLGHTVPMRSLRRFQECGHTVVLILGDYTARVGDPTGRTETRPPLTQEEIDRYTGLYLEQIGKVVDLRTVEVRRNSEWFAKMNFMDVLRLLARMTAAQILERDDFSKRYKEAVPIYLHEMLYPLMQGWDSVMIKADVELGATEQLYNLNVGRQLQKEEGQEPQVCLTFPILVGTDGVRKMGKSLGNFVGITEEPAQMFAKIMSVPDGLMENYFTLLTEMPAGEMRGLLQGHPRQAKARLGREIVAFFHGAQAAQEAAEQFDKVHAEHQLPDDIADFTVPVSEINQGRVGLFKLLVLAGFAKSNSDARRLVEGGGVSLNQQKVEMAGELAFSDGDILQVGRRKFVRLKKGK